MPVISRLAPASHNSRTISSWSFRTASISALRWYLAVTFKSAPLSIRELARTASPRAGSDHQCRLAVPIPRIDVRTEANLVEGSIDI